MCFDINALKRISLSWMISIVNHLLASSQPCWSSGLYAPHDSYICSSSNKNLLIQQQINKYMLCVYVCYVNIYMHVCLYVCVSCMCARVLACVCIVCACMSVCMFEYMFVWIQGSWKSTICTNITLADFFFLIAYFTSDVFGEPLTNREIPYIKVFEICPSPRGGGDRTHDLWVTRQDHYHVATRLQTWVVLVVNACYARQNTLSMMTILNFCIISNVYETKYIFICWINLIPHISNKVFNKTN